MMEGLHPDHVAGYVCYRSNFGAEQLLSESGSSCVIHQGKGLVIISTLCASSDKQGCQKTLAEFGAGVHIPPKGAMVRLP